MALRGFGVQTLAATPQPVFGTTTTAAVTPTPDQFTGGLTPASNPSQTVVPITQNIFRKGDRVLIGASNTFSQGSLIAPDGGPVTAINLTASNITVGGLTRPHASGEFVLLALPVTQVVIQNLGLLMYLGEDNTVGAGSTTLIQEILANTTVMVPAGGPACENAIDTQKLWVTGTAANTFIPSLLTT